MVRSLLAPAVLGGLFIVTLCFYEGMYLKDRWGTPGAEAELMGERFKQVPKEIGDWKGEDLPVEEQVKNTAGAVSYVSRRYENQETGKEVRLWLIVGHSRDICRHTPNVCYPSAGFRQDGRQVRQTIAPKSGDDAEFYTAKFIRDDVYGRQAERVFWAWNHPDTDEWEAPEDQRQHYGLSRALYKLYFTSTVLGTEKTPDDNVAAEFAKLMLPEIDKALFPESHTDVAAENVVDKSEDDLGASSDEEEVTGEVSEPADDAEADNEATEASVE